MRKENPDFSVIPRKQDYQKVLGNSLRQGTEMRCKPSCASCSCKCHCPLCACMCQHTSHGEIQEFHRAE
jgi:hypothetical protein